MSVSGNHGIVHYYFYCTLVFYHLVWIFMFYKWKILLFEELKLDGELRHIQLYYIKVFSNYQNLLYPISDNYNVTAVDILQN